MSRRRLTVALVAVLLVLAGCGASPGDPAPDREPYEVDERVDASIEPSDTELLPGLTTDGVVSASGLRGAHQRAIDGRSYTIDHRYVHVTEEGDQRFERVLEYELSIDPEANAVRLRGRQLTEGALSGLPATDVANATVDRWFGERAVSRIEYENGTVEYGSTDGDATTGAERRTEAETLLVSALGQPTDSTTVGTVDADDGTYYVIDAARNASDDDQGAERRTVAVRALVREDGLVRRTASESEQVFARTEGGVTAERTLTVSAVGETAVERPEWYEEALETIRGSENAG